MGSDLDIRAWQQIVSALGTLEHDERGSPGYSAYTAYARSLIRPVADRLGWDAKSDESPNVQKLRRTVLRDLGLWGEPQVLAEARRRFDAFIKDHSTLSPDDQEVVLPLVARDADAATFDTLHALAKSAKDPADLQRYYGALMSVRDDALAEQAAHIALSQELPAQMAMARPQLVFILDDQHPHLSWSTFSDNVDALMAPFPQFAPLIIAQYVPRGYWDTVPLEQLEAWVRAHVPAEMSGNVARGMDSARFLLSEKQSLVPEVDAYVRSLPQGSQVPP
jgi:aminopeptidase N